MSTKRDTKRRSTTSFLLVDAHNVIFARPDLAALHGRNPAAAREKLLQMLERLQDAGMMRVVAVFDGGTENKPASAFSSDAGVQIFYAGANHSADTVIERLIAKYAPVHRLTVATNDHLIRTACEAAGGEAISVEQLFDDIATVLTELGEVLNRLRRGK